ncbi:hypothetical protein [Streptomyces axinellae]|uniref:Uncharacterized protein n=1 Tax=Streptomyces axinellae TaxID=552788 RepID=A0ABP6C8U4_9ACTN
MKSWRTRIAVGLAAGAAAVAVPLTATSASADTAATDSLSPFSMGASASGWEIAGGESYPQGEAYCEAQAKEDYASQGYTDADCVPNPEIRPDFYTIWIYHP